MLGLTGILKQMDALNSHVLLIDTDSQSQTTPSQALRELVQSAQVSARQRGQPFEGLLDLLPNSDDDTEPDQNSNAPTEIEARLGGKFSADLAALLKKQSSNPIEEPAQLKTHIYQDHTIRQFALLCIQIGNVYGAIDFIQRHAPEQMDWLNTQLQQCSVKSPSIKSEQVLPKIKIIQQTVFIDAEAVVSQKLSVNSDYFEHGHMLTRLTMATDG